MKQWARWAPGGPAGRRAAAAARLCLGVSVLMALCAGAGFVRIMRKSHPFYPQVAWNHFSGSHYRRPVPKLRPLLRPDILQEKRLATLQPGAAGALSSGSMLTEGAGALSLPLALGPQSAALAAQQQLPQQLAQQSGQNPQQSLPDSQHLATNAIPDAATNARNNAAAADSSNAAKTKAAADPAGVAAAATADDPAVAPRGESMDLHAASGSAGAAAAAHVAAHAAETLSGVAAASSSNAAESADAAAASVGDAAEAVEPAPAAAEIAVGGAATNSSMLQQA